MIWAEIRARVEEIARSAVRAGFDELAVIELEKAAAKKPEPPEIDRADRAHCGCPVAGPALCDVETIHSLGGHSVADAWLHGVDCGMCDDAIEGALRYRVGPEDRARLRAEAEATLAAEDDRPPAYRSLMAEDMVRRKAEHRPPYDAAGPRNVL